MKPAPSPLGKLDSLWDDGVHLGVRGKCVGNKKGVWKNRTGRREQIEDWWTSSAPECVAGVPWRKSDEDPKVDGRDARSPSLDSLRKSQFRVSGRVQSPEVFTLPRKISRSTDFQVDTSGVAPQLAGGCRQDHSPACRARMEELPRGTDKFERTQHRVNEFVEKATIASQAKRTRKIETEEMTGDLVDNA